MAIDYVIDYSCVPKQTLGTEGILDRLKGRERAQAIIQMYRDAGDQRPPSEMGFDFTRRTAQGEEDTRLIVVQDLLDIVAELDPLAHHCAGCPANRTGQPFGCVGYVQYPVSGEAEAFLLNNLPVPDEPLVWLLLKQGVESFLYDGQQIAALRQKDETYFVERKAAVRRLGEFEINANQAFEMIFGVGDIIPNHAAMLLLFFNAIDRELDANVIMSLAPATAETAGKHPFLMQVFAHDERGVAEIKQFLHALWLAWTLNVKLIVDA